MPTSELTRIVEIVENWASTDADGIDDLDALCQIASVLSIEVQPRATTPVLADSARTASVGPIDFLVDGTIRLNTGVYTLNAPLEFMSKDGAVWNGMEYKPLPDLASSKCDKCEHNNVRFDGRCVHVFWKETPFEATPEVCGCKCEFSASGVVDEQTYANGVDDAQYIVVEALRGTCENYIATNRALEITDAAIRALKQTRQGLGLAAARTATEKESN